MLGQKNVGQKENCGSEKKIVRQRFFFLPKSIKQGVDFANC